jgi:hypothetical protein
MPVPERSYDLVQRMRELGADDPEGIGRIPAAQRAVAAGANPQDVAQAMRAAAYSAVHGVLYAVDGPDISAPEDAPSWILMEVRRDDDYEEIQTGRDLGTLHESILSADPSGREGADLWS